MTRNGSFAGSLVALGVLLSAAGANARHDDSSSPLSLKFPPASAAVHGNSDASALQLAGDPLSAVGRTTQAEAIEHQNHGIWSGYVAKDATSPTMVASPFTEVVAKWREPAVTCPDANARVSIWVGLDGDGSPTVEQVGTVATCNGLDMPVVHRAFWEMYVGANSPGQQPFTVSPGDFITASVRYLGNAYALEVMDMTNGRHFTTTKSCTAVCQRTTAEWIVERPGGGKYPLANYAEMKFTDVLAGTAGRGLGQPDSGLIQVTMEHRGTTLSTCLLGPSSRVPPSVVPYRRNDITCTWHAAE